MTSTLNLLRSALEKLEEAEENASLGTRMMIQPIREQLAKLIQRTENIEGENRER